MTHFDLVVDANSRMAKLLNILTYLFPFLFSVVLHTTVSVSSALLNHSV